MHLIELLKSYQGERTMSEYAADLGIGTSTLYTLYDGSRGVGPVIIRAFLRRYPEAAESVGRAQLADATAQPVEV